MTIYLVTPVETGWQLLGFKRKKAFLAKADAVVEGKKLAQEAKRSLIVTDKSGLVKSVFVYSDTANLRSAKLKRRLDSKTLRIAIAQTIVDLQIGAV